MTNFYKMTSENENKCISPAWAFNGPDRNHVIWDKEKPMTIQDSHRNNPYSSNRIERSQNSWNKNRNYNDWSCSRSYGRDKDYVPPLRFRHHYNRNNSDFNASVNEDNLVSRSSRRRHQEYPKESQNSYNASVNMAGISRCCNRHDSAHTLTELSNATISRKDVEIYKECDIKHKQTVEKKTLENTNSKNTALKNSKNSKKETCLEENKTERVTVLPKMDLRSSIKNINADSGFLSKSRLNNVVYNSSQCNISTTKSQSQVGINIISEVEESQDKLQINNEEFASSKTVKVKREKILENEIEICDNFSFEVDKKKENSQERYIFRENLTTPTQNQTTSFLGKIAKKKWLQDKFTGEDALDPSISSQNKVSKIPEMSQGTNTFEKTPAPLTQSQSLTPSLSIPCGQQIKSEMMESSPQKETEMDREHCCLNNFFSQMSPLTLSQEPFRKSQMTSDYSYVSNSLLPIPSSEMEVIKNEQNKIEVITPCPIKCQMKSFTGRESVSIFDEPFGESMLAHSDKDIINSSQTSGISSNVLLNFNSSKNLSNNSGKTPSSTSVNQSVSLQKENMFLKPLTPPVTSTQNSGTLNTICSPDISPITGRVCLPTFIHNTYKQLQPLNFEIYPQLISIKPPEMQDIFTQPFKMEDDTFNKVSMIDSLIKTDSCTKNREHIKIKSGRLFYNSDIPYSWTKFSEKGNKEAIYSEHHQIHQNLDKGQEYRGETAIENNGTHSPAINQCSNEVPTHILRDNAPPQEQNKESDKSDKEKNQGKEVKTSDTVEESQKNESKDEETEKGTLYVSKACLTNDFDSRKEAKKVTKEKMKIQNYEVHSVFVEDLCENKVHANDVPQSNTIFQGERKELERSFNEKNQKGSTEESLESKSNDEQKEKESLHIDERCQSNDLIAGKKTKMVSKIKMGKKYEPNFSVDKNNNDIEHVDKEHEEKEKESLNIGIAYHTNDFNARKKTNMVLKEEDKKNEPHCSTDKCDKNLEYAYKEDHILDDPKSCIEAYNSKVEEIVNKFRDLCEEKKRKFLKSKIPTRFTVRFQDEAKGLIVSKEGIEFVLMEDGDQDINYTLSAMVDTTSDLEKREISSCSMKNFIDGSRLKENTEENSNGKKRKKRKERSLEEPPQMQERWWDSYTKDIPESIFETNKENKWKTLRYNFDNKRKSEENSASSSKLRKLSENNDEEIFRRSKKKLKKSKKQE